MIKCITMLYLDKQLNEFKTYFLIQPMSRIAVITPTRDRAGKDGKGLLAETLESVRLQDADCVHVVVDDGSTDCTKDLVLSEPHQDRLVYIRREKPLGEKVTASIAANLGIQAVFDPERLPQEDRKKVEGVGAVTFLHSDDLLTEGSITTRSEALREKGAGMVYGVRYLIDVDGRIIGFETCPLERPNWKLILSTFNFPNHTATFDKDFLRSVGLFDPEIGYGEDVDLTARAIKKADRLGIGVQGIETPTMYRRLHQDTVTNFYHDAGLSGDEALMLERKNIDSKVELILVRGYRFLRRPQSYLPECIKKSLRPLRDALRQYVREQKQQPYRDRFLEKIITNVHGKQYTEGHLQTSV